MPSVFLIDNAVSRVPCGGPAVRNLVLKPLGTCMLTCGSNGVGKSSMVLQPIIRLFDPRVRIGSRMGLLRDVEAMDADLPASFASVWALDQRRDRSLPGDANCLVLGYLAKARRGSDGTARLVGAFFLKPCGLQEALDGTVEQRLRSLFMSGGRRVEVYDFERALAEVKRYVTSGPAHVRGDSFGMKVEDVRRWQRRLEDFGFFKVREWARLAAQLCEDEKGVSNLLANEGVRDGRSLLRMLWKYISFVAYDDNAQAKQGAALASYSQLMLEKDETLKRIGALRSLAGRLDGAGPHAQRNVRATASLGDAIGEAAGLARAIGASGREAEARRAEAISEQARIQADLRHLKICELSRDWHVAHDRLLEANEALEETSAEEAEALSRDRDARARVALDDLRRARREADSAQANLNGRLAAQGALENGEQAGRIRHVTAQLSVWFERECESLEASVVSARSRAKDAEASYEDASRLFDEAVAERSEAACALAAANEAETRGERALRGLLGRLGVKGAYDVVTHAFSAGPVETAMADAGAAVRESVSEEGRLRTEAGAKEAALVELKAREREATGSWAEASQEARHVAERLEVLRRAVATWSDRYAGECVPDEGEAQALAHEREGRLEACRAREREVRGLLGEASARLEALRAGDGVNHVPRGLIDRLEAGGVNATSGETWLASETPSRRAELVGAHPWLPSSVIVSPEDMEGALEACRGPEWFGGAYPVLSYEEIDCLGSSELDRRLLANPFMEYLRDPALYERKLEGEKAELETRLAELLERAEALGERLVRLGELRQAYATSGFRSLAEGKSRAEAAGQSLSDAEVALESSRAAVNEAERAAADLKAREDECVRKREALVRRRSELESALDEVRAQVARAKDRSAAEARAQKAKRAFSSASDGKAEAGTVARRASGEVQKAISDLRAAREKAETYSAQVEGISADIEPPSGRGEAERLSRELRTLQAAQGAESNRLQLEILSARDEDRRAQDALMARREAAGEVAPGEEELEPEGEAGREAIVSIAKAASERLASARHAEENAKADVRRAKRNAMEAEARLKAETTDDPIPKGEYGGEFRARREELQAREAQLMREGYALSERSSLCHDLSSRLDEAAGRYMPPSMPGELLTDAQAVPLREDLRSQADDLMARLKLAHRSYCVANENLREELRSISDDNGLTGTEENVVQMRASLERICSLAEDATKAADVIRELEKVAKGAVNTAAAYEGEVEGIRHEREAIKVNLIEATNGMVALARSAESSTNRLLRIDGIGKKGDSPANNEAFMSMLDKKIQLDATRLVDAIRDGAGMTKVTAKAKEFVSPEALMDLWHKVFANARYEVRFRDNRPGREREFISWDGKGGVSVSSTGQAETSMYVVLVFLVCMTKPDHMGTTRSKCTVPLLLDNPFQAIGDKSLYERIFEVCRKNGVQVVSVANEPKPAFISEVDVVATLTKASNREGRVYLRAKEDKGVDLLSSAYMRTLPPDVTPPLF